MYKNIDFFAIFGVHYFYFVL